MTKTVKLTKWDFIVHPRSPLVSSRRKVGVFPLGIVGLLAFGLLGRVCLESELMPGC